MKTAVKRQAVDLLDGLVTGLSASCSTPPTGFPFNLMRGPFHSASQDSFTLERWALDW